MTWSAERIFPGSLSRREPGVEIAYSTGRGQLYNKAIVFCALEKKTISYRVLSGMRW